MSFPGFTAESSLYRTRVLYRLANVWSTGSWNDASGLVNPAGPICMNNCAADTYCCGPSCCLPTWGCCDSGCCDGVCYGGEDGEAQCCPSDATLCSGGEACAGPGETCCGDITCGPNRVCCQGGGDDYCIPEDSANCGACAATNPGTSTACASGQTCSNHQCSCSDDTDCGSEQTCDGSGVCQCGSDSGSVACGPNCIPEDESNCGSCLNACPTGWACCGGTCTDTSSDNYNCGGCGNSCNTKAGQTCQNGTCACPDTQTSLDTPSDCGTCGKKCTGKTPDCCNYNCVNVDNNNNNCGSCGNTCTFPETCQFGACVCLHPYSKCRGKCVNAQTDPNNCGPFCTKCPNNYSCVGGRCKCSGGVICGGPGGSCCLWPNICVGKSCVA
jgi:hypothetical protein